MDRPPSVTTDPCAASIEKVMTGEFGLGPWKTFDKDGLKLRHIVEPIQPVIYAWYHDTPLAAIAAGGMVTVYKNGLEQELAVKTMLEEVFGAVLVLDAGEATVFYIEKAKR